MFATINDIILRLFMYWNYRVIEKAVNMVEEGYEYCTTSYTINEVYYDEDGSITMWSAEPISPYGQGCIKDLEVDIKFMFEACSKPILKESDLPDSGEYLSGLLKENGL